VYFVKQMGEYNTFKLSKGCSVVRLFV